MSKLRPVLGLAAGVILIISSAAHSVFGWKELRAELDGAHVPADLVFALGVGWQFGGLAMFCFGLIVARIFLGRLKNGTPAAFPAAVIAAAYGLFGVWALVASGFRLFYLVFIVPALLIGVAVPGGTGYSNRTRGGGAAEGSER
jgi:hypothetical protein